MNVRVQLSVEGREVDEQVSGDTPDDILILAKNKVQSAMGWKGMVVAAMSPISFARTAVKLYNERHNTSYALPDSAKDFIDLGVDLGYVTILPD